MEGKDPPKRRNSSGNIDDERTISKAAEAERTDRYKYDMEHAYAVRRAHSSSLSASSSWSPQALAEYPGGGVPSRSMGGSHRKSAEEDLNLALRGLDKAEELKSSGPKDQEEAMWLYQTSIGRLIKLLNSGNLPSGVSGDTIAERVRVALTDAENLKAAISKKAQSRNQTKSTNNGQSPKQSSPAKTETQEGGKSRLGWIFRGGQTNDSNNNSPPASAKKKDVQQSKGGQAKSTQKKGRPTNNNNTQSDHRETPIVSMAMSSTESSRAKSRPLATSSGPSSRQQQQQQQQQQQRHNGQSRAAASQPSHRHNPQPAPSYYDPSNDKRRKKQSNLDYDNDPLVKSIKADLYVDSSTISTQWSDIAGLTDAKRSLQEAAILPLLRPDLYVGLRSPPRGILLYGPPGTGKTMLVRAVAHESRCILFSCTASALTSKWHGEGEKLVRTLFRVAADVAPTLLFFDEIDALLSSRKGEEHEASRRFKTEFMVQMDGIVAGGGGKREQNAEGDGNDDSSDLQRRVLVLGCTNCPWDIDDAVMRRFQRKIYVPLPDTEARRALWDATLAKAAHDLTKSQKSFLVTRTEGFSCSDIASIANEAAFGPLRSLGDIDAIRNVDAKKVRKINARDFTDAIGRSKKSVSGALLEKYDKWEQEQAASGR